MSDIDSKIVDWFCNGNTGASSKCMAFHLTGRESDGSYPHDSSDFGRCVELLKAVPQLREKLHEMVGVNSYWAALIPHWQEIEKLTDYKTQTQKIDAVLKPIEDKDAGVVRLGKGLTMRVGRIK